MSTFDQMAEMSESQESVEITNPSFDDIEAATEVKEEAPKYEASEVEGVEEEANEHAKAAASSDGNDVEGRNEETGEVEKKTDEESTEETPEIKMLKAALEDSEYDIPADANLTAIVDGEETPVSVQELLNNYSGKVAYDKKFQELGNTRKEVETKNAELTKTIDTFMSSMEEGKINDALMLIADKAGKNPYEFMKEIREGFLEQNQILNTLSPEQKEAFLAKEEAEYLRKQNESVLEKEQARSSQEQLQTSLTKLQETHGVEDTELEQRWNDLVKLSGGDVESLLDKYGGQEGVVNALEQFTVNSRAYERSYSLLENYKDVISPEESKEVVEKLVDSVLADSTLTDDTLSEWLEEAFASRKSSEKISKKAKKAKKVLPEAKQKAEVENYFDFDDLD